MPNKILCINLDFIFLHGSCLAQYSLTTAELWPKRQFVDSKIDRMARSSHLSFFRFFKSHRRSKFCYLNLNVFCTCQNSVHSISMAAC
jgi:hypothetical protein